MGIMRHHLVARNAMMTEITRRRSRGRSMLLIRREAIGYHLLLPRRHCTRRCVLLVGMRRGIPRGSSSKPSVMVAILLGWALGVCPPLFVRVHTFRL